MKRLLILFANGFPYNISEPFLEAEIPLYRTYFDHVLISTNCKRGESATRKLDSDFFEVLDDYTLSRDLRSMLRAIPDLLTDKKYYRELFHLIRSRRWSLHRLYDVTVAALCGNHRARCVWSWLRRHDTYDSIVIYSYWLSIPAYGALRLKRLLGDADIRVASRCHGFDLYSARSQTGYLPFQEAHVRELDVVAPVSQNGVDYLHEQYPACTNIEPRYLGVTVPDGENPSVEREPLRIVSCSRVIPLKRLTRIVDTLTLWDGIPLQWMHIGGGEELETVTAYAKEKLSGKANVSFTFLGTIPNTELHTLYAAQPFHVFLNVSETEGIPVAIMEAMSYGIPVIATAVGGTPELVTDGENGYLLDRDFSDETLVEKIQTIAQLSGEAYTSMRGSARRRVRQNFNAEENYRRFIEEVLLG